jgi:thymidylate synthase (FAD)
LSLPPELLHFQSDPIKVLDEGFVQLVDVMGCDTAIVQAARVSYGKGTKKVSDDRHLLRYLLRQGHTSPFEMCEIKLRLQIPNDIWKHILRHRTASVNETSTRYSEALDSYHKAEEWRTQAKDNKQGSSGQVTQFPEGWEPPAQMGVGPQVERDEDGNFTPGAWLTAQEQALHRHAQDVYKERLDFGVAREQARKDLPFGFYTRAIWKMDVHNLLHFLKLRLHPHAQYETRMYAEAIASIVKVWLPDTWSAFEDYVLEATKFSRQEMRGLALAISDPDFINRAVRLSGLRGREQKEFKGKLLRMFETL